MPSCPLAYAKRTKVGPLGQAIGTYATSPEEVDDIAVHAWQQIYAGNVDDMAATHNSSDLYKEYFAHLSATMRITDYDEAPISRFCGIAVQQRTDGSIGLSQTSYIHEVLARLGLSDCAEALSPEATGSKSKLRPLTEPLSPSEAAFMSEVPYREAVGALWYVARGTRMDIFRAVQEVAAHAENPGPIHWRALLRIFRYLKRTASAELLMRSCSKLGEKI